MQIFKNWVQQIYRITVKRLQSEMKNANFNFCLNSSNKIWRGKLNDDDEVTITVGDVHYFPYQRIRIRMR